MQFSEEKNEMTVTEIVRITNNGNAAGNFKWVNEKRIFTMNPEEGMVPSNGFLDCLLTYNPTPVAGQNQISQQNIQN